jgi:hypothetical protein
MLSYHTAQLLDMARDALVASQESGSDSDDGREFFREGEQRSLRQDDKEFMKEGG